METEQALTRVDDTAIPAIEVIPGSYGNDLALAGLAADHASRTDTFAQYHAEQTVNGYGGRTGRSVDNDRARRSVPTRKSTKKAQPVLVSKAQALRLKTETTRPKRPRRRAHDLLLEARDALLMGLFIEHAFRVSEVAGLNVEDFDLDKGIVMIYRSKTDETQIHKLKKHTLMSA